jgi:hypothetical protein
MPIMIRIHKHCTPEVADALDRLHKEMKKPTLKRPLCGGAVRHEDEIETAIIQALAPLQYTQDFEEVISNTNAYKQTLAHFAVQFGYADLLRRLVGWNIDLSIADVNGFTALHFAYKKGDRACVDLLLENGASETVLDALGRAPSHLMPEDFALLSDHDSDTASDDQLEMEREPDAPSLFQSTDSWHGGPDSGDEKPINKAGSADLIHQSRASSAASNSQSTHRLPPLPVAPEDPPLSPTSLGRYHTIFCPPPPEIRLPTSHLIYRASASSPSSLQHGQEPPGVSVPPINIHPGAIRAVPDDNPGQQSPEFCGGLHGGVQAICVPGTQNEENAAAPQQLDVRTNHEPMNHDQTTTSQASWGLATTSIEANSSNGTVT